jgi:glycosyltransferase involved in cell wall biosynthesis
MRKPEGGLGNYIHKTALELTRRGNRVVVFVYGVDRGKKNDDGIEVFFVPRFRFHWRIKQNPNVATWLGLIEWWMNVQRMRQAVLSYHKRFQLDIVQTPNYNAPGYILCHNPAFPLVCRCSSYAPMWRAANGLSRQLPEVISDWIETRQVQEAQSTFAPSQLISDAYVRMEGYHPRVIRTPIEIHEIQTDDTCYKSDFIDKSYLLYFGTLKLVKGVDLLADVIPFVLKKHPGLTFAFVGRDDGLNNGQKIFAYIRDRNKNFENQLIYHPALPKASLYPIIANALGVLMPSRVDNYPNACLEALSLGVPVIGTYQSSLDEMIIEGKTGFLANNSDPMSICAAIEQLLSLNPAERNKMKSDIKSAVHSNLAENHVDQLIHFYQENIDIFRLGRDNK